MVFQNIVDEMEGVQYLFQCVGMNVLVGEFAVDFFPKVPYVLPNKSMPVEATFKVDIDSIWTIKSPKV
jgi:hypothetical protein